MPRPRRHEPTDLLLGVQRAVRLLNRFTVDEPALDLARAARYLGVPRSTAYRVLRSLEATGILVYDRQHMAYRLSLALARLGQVALAGVDLRAVARPWLRRLVEETGESAFLLVVEGRSAIVIDMVASDAPLKLTFPVGTPWPLHAGASNKVLLAFLPEEAAAEVLAGPLPAVTPRTTTDPAELRAQLQRIRRRGYAHSVGELTPGVVGIAVPIRSRGQLLGGLAVAGPLSRLPVSRVPQAVDRLKRAAEEIAQGVEGTGTHKPRGWKG
ncbi:MAG TPA: IclR family transcriptional regulator [bacterium]|nr:IclR family transcriptional regulator [bacterium]